MPDFTFDPERPLERCQGESKRANLALRDYCIMGGGRSISKLLKRYLAATDQQPPTRREPTLKTWSARFRWQARLALWENTQQKAEEEHWRKRRLEIRRDDDSLGKRLREVVQEFLADLPKFTQTRRVKQGEKMTTDPDTGEPIKEVTYIQFVKINTNPGQLGQASKAASELQRTAAGFIDKLALTDPTGEKAYDPFTSLLKEIWEEDDDNAAGNNNRANGSSTQRINGKDRSPSDE